MKVTVYTAPYCTLSKATVTMMKRLGIEYECIDVTSKPGLAEALLDVGHKAFPVVIAEDGDRKSSWWGFRPGMIQQLAQFAS